MDGIVIVLVVIIVVVLVAALALNPVLRKANERAIARARERLGGRDRIKVIEPKAVGFASEPPEAGGLRGQGCLAVNDTELVFVTTSGQKEFVIPRSAISSVDTSGDPRSPAKAMISVHYRDPEHGEVTASWRLPDSPDWLRELGYDWGPEGPPPADGADDAGA